MAVVMIGIQSVHQSIQREREKNFIFVVVIVMKGKSYLLIVTV